VFDLDAWSISQGQSKEHESMKTLRHNASQGRSWLYMKSNNEQTLKQSNNNTSLHSDISMQKH